MEKGKSDKIIALRTLILIVISVWIVSGIISWSFFEDWSKSASFGDTFGAINSLFSGLALAGIIYTIYLQKTELSLQRKELEYTRKELSRTADAQEQNAKLMNEQIRLNNFPYLQSNSTNINNKKAIIISNQSNRPMFNIEIWLFIELDEKKNSKAEFIENWFEKPNYVRIKNPDSKKDYWTIYEKGFYDAFPSNKKILIPLDYPLGDGDFVTFIQYRDILGNNYSQRTEFWPNPFSDSPIRGDSTPIIPELTVRFDEFKKETFKASEFASDLLDCWTNSIGALNIKDCGRNGKDFNWWEIMEIEKPVHNNV